MIIAIIIAALITIIGNIMIQKTGNYENIWGFMFWYGLIAVLILVAIKSILILIALCSFIITLL